MKGNFGISVIPKMTKNRQATIEQGLQKIDWLTLIGYILVGTMSLGVLCVIIFLLRFIVTNIRKCQAKKTVK